MSFDMPVESVGTVAGAQSWRQRIPNFMRCDRNYEHLMLCVRTERWADWY